MSDFLGFVYCSLFEKWFGAGLADHFFGFDCVTGEYSLSNQFNLIGLMTFIISLVSMIAYYYWPLDHPRFSKWWTWLIMLFVNSAICLFAGFYFANSDRKSGAISDCLMYFRDESGEILSTLITSAECWGFGLANSVIAAIFFFFLSMLFKW